MIAGDWQVDYGTLHLAPATTYRLAPPIDGLSDHPGVRSSDQTRLRAHGLLAGDDFLDGRSITVPIRIFGGDSAGLSTAVAALKAALVPGAAEAPLTFQLPGVAGGGVRRINARPRRLSLPVDFAHAISRTVLALVGFDACDPRIYDETATTLTTGLAASVAGLSWPLAWNLNWGGASVGNSVIATNIGSFSTPWTARIDGPVTNPSVENVTTGQVLSLSGDGGLVLAAGEWVDLDSSTRTVLLGGTASRYSALTSSSSWWDLPPGSTTLRFAGTTTGSPQLAITFRSAWI